MYKYVYPLHGKKFRLRLFGAHTYILMYMSHSFANGNRFTNTLSENEGVSK